MEAREHSAASRTDYALGGAAKGVVGGGLLGVVGGALTGAVYGAIAGVINPLGLAAVGIGAAVAGIAALASAPWAATALLVGIGVPAALGGLMGAVAGAGIGGGVGAGLFGVKGALHGAGRANDESQLYAQHKQAYREARQDAISQARADAAEQYTAAGYMAAAQELGPYYYRQGQESVVQQIIAAKQQQLAMANGDQSFVQRVGGKPAESHAQAVAESQAQPAIPGQTV